VADELANHHRPLVSAEAYFCVVGRLGRKKKRARGERIVPNTLSIFSIIAIFIGIPSGSLCGGERSQAVLL